MYYDGACALRAQKPRIRSFHIQKWIKIIFFNQIFWRTMRVQPRSRVHNARAIDFPEKGDTL